MRLCAEVQEIEARGLSYSWLMAAPDHWSPWWDRFKTSELLDKKFPENTFDLFFFLHSRHFGLGFTWYFFLLPFKNEFMERYCFWEVVAWSWRWILRPSLLKFLPYTRPTKEGSDRLKSGYLLSTSPNGENGQQKDSYCISSRFMIGDSCFYTKPASFQNGSEAARAINYDIQPTALTCKGEIVTGPEVL